MFVVTGFPLELFLEVWWEGGGAKHLSVMKFWSFGLLSIILRNFLSRDSRWSGLVTVGGGIFQSMRGVYIRRKPIDDGWLQTMEIVF